MVRLIPSTATDRPATGCPPWHYPRVSSLRSHPPARPPARGCGGAEAEMAFRALTDRRSTGTDYPSGPRAMRLLCWTRKTNVSGKGEARRERSERVGGGAALSSHDQVRPRVFRGCHHVYPVSMLGLPSEKYATKTQDSDMPDWTRSGDLLQTDSDTRRKGRPVLQPHRHALPNRGGLRGGPQEAGLAPQGVAACSRTQSMLRPAPRRPLPRGGLGAGCGQRQASSCTG